MITNWQTTTEDRKRRQESVEEISDSINGRNQLYYQFMTTRLHLTMITRPTTRNSVNYQKHKIVF